MNRLAGDVRRKMSLAARDPVIFIVGEIFRRRSENARPGLYKVLFGRKRNRVEREEANLRGRGSNGRGLYRERRRVDDMEDYDWLIVIAAEFTAVKSGCLCLLINCGIK